MMQSSEHTQTNTINISLAYATVTEQHYQELQVPLNTNIYQALQQSGWLDSFLELKTWCEQVLTITQPSQTHWMVGVYSKKQPLCYVLQPYDRIEIYRPLTDNPMKKRKDRAVNPSTGK